MNNHLLIGCREIQKIFGKQLFFKTLVIFSLFSISLSVCADGWRHGFVVSYVSGLSDVADLHEDNLEAEPFISGVDVEKFPIGIGYRGRLDKSNGMRVDIGVGPELIIFGDAEHFEMPIEATVGYNFFPSADSSPYVRLGGRYHFVSGDYVEDSKPGLLGALGVEVGRNNRFTWGFEISIDDSTVEFEDLTRAGNRELNTFDKQLTLFFLF